MNIANKLTVLRIALIPFMLWLIFHNSLLFFVPGFILAILIGFTDLFDGYIARKYSIETYFGKFLLPTRFLLFQFCFYL